VFVTVDALIRWGADVLLIERGHAPGKGLLALPGGFVEPRDTLWESCLRELAEETHLAEPEAVLRRALEKVQVFDHPDRSQRGRTITHVHAFDLSSRERPAVRAGDDAARTHWVSVRELVAMEDRFFEDHFHILDQFLQLTE
jgi:bifunctional NMN adenylyltransferase/nudix hydrolase